MIKDRETLVREPRPCLLVTLARLDALIREKGLNCTDVLDVHELARTTASPEAEVRALLKGEILPEADVEDRVCRRIRSRYRAHLSRTGKTPAKVVKEVAAHLDVTTVWARNLLNGDKTPNVRLLHGLQTFFQVDEGFFTATASDALNKALQPVLRNLENDDIGAIAELVERTQLATVSLRVRQLTPRQEIMIVKMIEVILESDAGVGG